MPRPFYLGLNLSGTVSAGAYTAGAMDFLIEAMDAWYTERERQKQQHGTNFDAWTVPPHELQLAVMAGASGGGITAALAAASLSHPFSPVTTQSPGPGAGANRLFQTWVSGIDIEPLLGHADLDSNRDQVASLLDSTIIRSIASRALELPTAPPTHRPWVSDRLKVILTLTNIGGIPYAVEPQTGSEFSRTLYYADQRHFEILWAAGASGGETVPLDAGGGKNWKILADTAIATGAFPVVLAPQVLSRAAGDYNRRRWRIPVDKPKSGVDGVCECEEVSFMPPAWNLADEVQFSTLNADGGATNNSPFDCARLELAALDPPNRNGRNIRDPQRVDRVVVSIAPLFTELAPNLPPPPKTDMASMLFQLVDVVVNQSRIQGENLRLTSDPEVASRWVITPTAHAGLEPLAGSLVGAFGGFISQLFREHDYQLGRRNCQRFLSAYFGLPWTNELMRSYNLSAESQSRLDREYGFLSEDGRSRLFPLLPVLPPLRPEIRAARNPMTQDRLRQVGDLATDRLKRVAKALLAEHGAGGISEFAFNAAWLLLKGKLRDAILLRAAKDLSSQGFL